MMILVRQLDHVEKNFLEYFKTNYWFIFKPIIGLFLNKLFVCFKPIICLFLNQLLIWIKSKYCSCFGVGF